jgi:hypothetical protein
MKEAKGEAERKRRTKGHITEEGKAEERSYERNMKGSLATC